MFSNERGRLAGGLFYILKGEKNMATVVMDLSILKKYGDLSPSRILRYLIEDTFFQIEHAKNPWTFFILGRNGPTGKTWLCNGLRKYGFMAFELSESILPFVSYQDNGNHVIKDEAGHNIIIILNRSLKGEV